MLKTIELPDKPAPNKNDSSWSAFNRNNNSRPASKKNNINGEGNGLNVGKNSIEHTKKLRKSSKSEKLKSEKNV